MFEYFAVCDLSVFLTEGVGFESHHGDAVGYGRNGGAAVVVTFVSETFHCQIKFLCKFSGFSLDDALYIVSDIIRFAT